MIVRDNVIATRHLINLAAESGCRAFVFLSSMSVYGQITAPVVDAGPALAAQHAETALALKVIGGDWMLANVLTTLGQALSRLGQTDRARACWSEALSIHEEFGAAEAEQVRALLSPAAAA